MKSLLALHLLAFLLILATFHVVRQATASVASEIVTTTAQPPSLRAPHRSSALPTRVMSTQRRTPTTTKTPAAVRRQETPIARSSAHATAKRTPAASDHVLATEITTKPNLARPLRSVGASQSGVGARQNRSLQSGLSSSTAYGSNNTTTTTTTNSSNSNNGNSLTAVGNHQQKHEQAERRHHFRTNRHGSYESIKSTTTTTTKPFRVSTNARIKLEASQHQSRDSSSLPLDAANVDEAAKNATNQQRQTIKTPRMIHRLIAGHIQNAEGRSTYQVSSVSSNSTVTRSTPTTSKPTTSAPKSVTSKPIKTSARYSAAASNVKPIKLQTILSQPDSREDDEALLDDPGDFDNWDNGILRLSAGSGKESSKSKKLSKDKDKDDSKKTLSDQVRDGKYGLIEKELFRREPKRPGVLSYLPNKEVPVDNERTYGGLQEEDIWLAEDHLLVIKGGSLNEDGPQNEPWAPIDDYDAPGRQIKIPSNPKVPPPFPVQLEENGPVQFIGNSKFTVVYPVANESIPIYTAGTEADHTPPENDSDHSKNLLARPGASQDTASGEPQYVYPAPYPSWLFDNQTFVNPLLSNARPITFPGLGPFPFGRNGSLENSNLTDYFDEDDPNLYYPPAYSFVYKNNYSNPVPPGPLVPGIVLPPPANQFSRLEKPEKTRTSPQTILTRQRVPISTSTTTSTTSTTTTTTTPPPPPSSTTQIPFRAVITKITEYTPKIINITPATPTVSTAIPSTPIAKLPPTPPSSPLVPITPPPSSLPIEPVPVPVAVPIPIYPSRHYSPSRPSIIAFVPTTPGPATAPLSKANPIYYEYFETKRQPIKTNVIDDFLATTVEPPPSPKPIKLYATSKRPFKTQQHRNYYQPPPPLVPQRTPYKDNIVYITPKPEIRYKVPPNPPIFKARPLENFEREVSALRETLRYYQNQQLRDNSIPRTPKVKPLYEFTFDATKNLQRPEESPTGNEFRPPIDFDNEPFKPMVTYSPPMNDENSFSPMAYDKSDVEVTQKLTAESKQLEDPPTNYQPTTTLLPVPPENDYQLLQQTPQARLKKQRLSAKYLQEPFVDQQQRQPQPQPFAERNSLSTQRPWIAIGKVQVPQNVYDSARLPEEPSQRYEQYQYAPPKQRAYPGYFYGPPQPPPQPQQVNSRQNNRYYDEPFQGPVRKIITQRTRPNVHYQQAPQQNYWGLENDTYVNFAPNRPTVNPDAEFIDPYQGPYAGHDLRYSQPALSHQSQYYAPPQQQQQQQRLPPQLPLHRDILVNYRQPLPPINPDSEFIGHPQVVRNQQNQIYRSDSYQRLSPTLIDNEDEQRGVYYASPKYRRANNSNNNNNNNNPGNGGSNGNGSHNANKQQSREGRSANSNSNKNNSDNDENDGK